MSADTTSLAMVFIPPGVSIIFPTDTGIGTIYITQAALYALGIIPFRAL